MYYIPPKFPRMAVLYLREGPDISAYNTPAFQENLLRDYCRSKSLSISHTVRVSCGPEESLDFLRQLLRLLPPKVDTLLATEFFIYSPMVRDLGQLAMAFQCRRTWLYSLDTPGVMYRSFPTVTVQDYELTDQRYAEWIK